MKKTLLLLTLLTLLLNISIFGQKIYQYPFQNPSLTVDERVKDLLSRMTLDEKVSQMIDIAPAIPRLNIPAYNWWNEALHGVARAGVATVFPQAIGLGATWDTTLIYKVADIISTEARAKHHEALRNNDFGRYKGLTIWSPNINIFRDPRWGRGQETYGEDPYLTSRIGVAFVKGLQGDDPKYIKTISTPKHYAVHSGPEPERHRFNAVTDKRDFYETYSPAFKALITEGKAWSIMGAYNRYMNDPACASPFLLQQILRDSWKFKGYVVSDCDAIADIWRDHKTVKTDAEAAAISIKAGCDLNCGDTYLALTKAVKQGLVTEADVDKNLYRVFEARFRLGMFDPAEMVKYAQIPYSANDTKGNREIAYKSALESIVLLKNEGNALPLKKNLKTIAVVGPNANKAFVMYGNYNGVPSVSVTPLDGIKNKAGAGVNVLYAQGCGWAEAANSLAVVPSELLGFNGKQGLQAEYYSNMKFEGEPAVKRIDKKIDFNWGDRPPKGLTKNFGFSVRWTGTITVPENGSYTFAVSGDDGYRLYIDGKLLIDNWVEQAETTLKTELTLAGGKGHDIKLEYFQNQGDASIRLEYFKKSTVDPIVEAVDIAGKSDVVVFFAGLSSSLEGEEMRVDYDGFKGGDRTSIDLPKIQSDLIRKLQATGKPVVVVLMSGSPVALNWEDENLPAILQAWYPGEEGGNAIADVLFGNYNPAGRLPVTFYKSVDQLPSFEEYAMKGRTYRYFNGQPLYPFGYGLSYSKFVYSNLQIPSSAETGRNITVSVDVTNIGSVEGDEVVQLYVSNKSASVPVPIRSLEGFSRVNLKPGEKRTVTFTLKPYQLSVIDDNTKRMEQAGTFELSVGGGQPVVMKRATSDFVTGMLKITGDTKELEL